VADRLTTRPDPEALLQQVQVEEEYQKRGRLKIFLGYLSGVGKSFRMFDEGRRRRERGQDVVVGAIQPVNSPEVEELLKKMEVIPLKRVEGLQAMDVDAILHRRPRVCLIDGLAYDNPSGSLHAKRWQDVEQLLAVGISVIGSVNLQYIDEYREQVERITDKRVTSTIPLSFMHSADEVEVVDMPTERCLERAEGASAHDTAAPGPQQLSELREIALLLAADVVDRQLERYLKSHGIEQLWGAQERILVFIRPGLNAEKMIESGRRNADRFHGELFVVHVSDPDLSSHDKSTLETNLTVARQLDAHIESLEAEDPVNAIMDFARAHHITQIFIGHSRHENWWQRLWGSFVGRLIREAEGIDVRIFPN
jgi:two-component system sensor histidine kinase KdpD